MERPGYDPLPGAARLLGANIVRFERRFEDGFALDPDAVARALTPRTRLVIISSPHNPTGALAERAALEAIGQIASRRRRLRPRRRGVPRRGRSGASAGRAPRRSVHVPLHLHQQPDEVLRALEPALRMDDFLACRRRAHPPRARRHRWVRIHRHRTAGDAGLCPTRSPRGESRRAPRRRTARSCTRSSAAVRRSTSSCRGTAPSSSRASEGSRTRARLPSACSPTTGRPSFLGSSSKRQRISGSGFGGPTEIVRAGLEQLGRALDGVTS